MNDLAVNLPLHHYDSPSVKKHVAHGWLVKWVGDVSHCAITCCSHVTKHMPGVVLLHTGSVKPEERHVQPTIKLA